MECIVLAGGPGTRLRGVIGETPKCMALVAGKPFLHHLFDYLEAQHCTKAILSLGYKHEMVEAWLDKADWNFTIETVIETEALGTGGGIQLAMTKASAANVFVINGDTLFRVDLDALALFHTAKNSCTTLALKSLQDFDRYGVVCCAEDGTILSFEEKKPVADGLINGGIYLVNKAFFEQKRLPQRHSFEKDYLEAFVTGQQFYGYRSSAYFIDIGIPADYEQAQKDLAG